MNVYYFKITDVAGRVFGQKALSLPQNNAVYTHEVGDLPKGYYIVSLTHNGKLEGVVVTNMYSHTVCASVVCSARTHSVPVHAHVHSLQ